MSRNGIRLPALNEPVYPLPNRITVSVSCAEIAQPIRPGSVPTSRVAHPPPLTGRALRGEISDLVDDVDPVAVIHEIPLPVRMGRTVRFDVCRQPLADRVQRDVCRIITTAARPACGRRTVAP